jgi:hypothetical protein
MGQAEKTNFDFEFKNYSEKNRRRTMAWQAPGDLELDAALDRIFDWQIQDVTDRRIKEDENYYLSYHDQLTGLTTQVLTKRAKRLDTAGISFKLSWRRQRLK